MGGKVFLQIIFFNFGGRMSNFRRSWVQNGFQVARGEYFR
jgi:hypothetical protein